MEKQKTGAQLRSASAKIKRLNFLVEKVCGIYARVAKRLGVHRTYVSRVAHGERHSPPVEKALLAEFDRAQND